MLSSIKRLVIGQPIPTEHAHHEKLPKIIALPVFASDALSSTAYASEEIMAALLLAGAGFFYLTPQLSLGIALLLAIVVISYRQTVMAYPGGGGAYIVAKDNLGRGAAQAAGAALLIDYVLTVSVSIAAGIAAITSLLETVWHIDIHAYTVLLCLLATMFVAVMNLRGVRESGAAFALPSYTFVAVMYSLLAVGFYKWLAGDGLAPVHSQAELLAARTSGAHGAGGHGLETLTPFLLLRAFASGCTALTGTEAISNGVTAFKEPAARNAAAVMVWMGLILGSLFIGLSFLAVHIQALPPTAAGYSETVVSQVGRTVFQGIGPTIGGQSIFYFLLQIATCAILILAANTAFADFPRLSSLMARDGYLPRQLGNIGDKLVFNNGIMLLAVLSAALIVVFKGSVNALIPLYCVGVFLSFTLSQAGMVKRWRRLKTPGWQVKTAVNGFGAVATCIVMIVFGVVKFSHGAWVVVVLVPALIFIFSQINAHYRSVAKQLSLNGYRPRQAVRHHVAVLVPDIHRGIIPALQYARSMSQNAHAIHVSIDPTREERLQQRWTLWSRGIPLTILPSPFRSLVEPVMQYIDRIQAQDSDSIVTIIIPEFVPTGWWAKLLHGHAGFALALRLHFKQNVVVVNVPYHIEAYVPLPKNDGEPQLHTLSASNGHVENSHAVTVADSA
ncbi:MAG TPA: APC family permease [Abditibacteriaceae bacterium]|jgi:amino acid transporter